VVAAVRARLAGIEKEYNELDGVWFMAGSLFNKWVLRGQGAAVQSKAVFSFVFVTVFAGRRQV
jgi:hypothetical protein